MRAAVLILVVSVLCLGVGLAVPDAAGLLVLAFPGLVVGLVLVLRAVLPRLRRRRRRWILLDGSNILYWNGNSPRIDTLRMVVRAIEARGFDPCVVFDANAGYVISGAYRDDRALAAQIALPPEQVMVVPRGTVADRFILAAARDLQARVVSNDRFRDWAGEFPEIREADRLIRGGFRANRLWLDRIEDAESGS